MQQKNASSSEFEAEAAPDQCPADAMPVSSRARPKIVPRCSVGCPATASKKPEDGSLKPDTVSKKLPAAMPGYCTLREQCFACFQSDLGPARGSNVSFNVFWEPNHGRHWKISEIHDPHMTFANSRLQPGHPKLLKNNPPNEINAKTERFVVTIWKPKRYL